MPPTAESHRAGTWPGVVDSQVLTSSYVDDVNRLADAAREGIWDSVFQLLDRSGSLGPNTWRVGGTSWYTPIHQVAWHGAETEVAERLIELGAWRSLRDSSGKRPVDIAEERGHRHLLPVLGAAAVSDHDRRRYGAWDRHLADLIAERTRQLGPVRFRPVPTEIVVLEGLEPLWFAYPGMYGGFALSVFKGRLLVESWSRVVGGSGQAHVITESGGVLVEEGFV